MINDSSKRKILYVCPLAHHGGHRPAALITETGALASAGFDVTLLTFDGFPDDRKSLGLQQKTVLSPNRFSAFVFCFIKILNHWRLTESFVPLFEQFLTLLKAISLNKKMQYDLIHLRDGDPFVFLVLFFNFFIKGYNWVVHLTFDPRKVMGKIDYACPWQPIYRRSLIRNRFVFLCENETIRREYGKVMKGLFREKAIYSPLTTQFVGNSLSKEDARHFLGLPANKNLFLCFGSLHSGKDLRVVASGCRDLFDAIIVIAGKASIEEIDELRAISNNLLVRNYYIPEKEKPLYYASADAVIISYHKSFLERMSGAMLWDACKFAAPVIASDGGQIGELVKSFQIGLTFEPENAISLKNAIVHYSKLGQADINIFEENCNKFCDSFSTESWGKRYKAMYNNFFAGCHTEALP